MLAPLGFKKAVTGFLVQLGFPIFLRGSFNQARLEVSEERIWLLVCDTNLRIFFSTFAKTSNIFRLPF